MSNFIDVQVYPYRRHTAERWNQMDSWRESRKANIAACRDLSAVIMNLYGTNAASGEYWGQATTMLTRYGPARITFLLATTVKYHLLHETERPFTLRVRNWASTAWPMAPVSSSYVISAPAVAVMRFIDACRQVEEEM